MFKVKCPVCGGVLTIDERDRAVVGHTTRENAAKSSEQRFESIVDGIQKAKTEREAQMETAKAREARHKERLEDLFKKAQEKAKEKPDDDKPPGPVWD